MFVDLVGSTSMALAMPPTEVVRLLNRFFRVVVEVVEAEGGLVNKFEGDAALCVFGAPVASDDPAGDALRAARTLAERLEREVREIGFGIGVSAGLAVAGNVGSEQRFEYTVIGDPVNEAARLCDLAKERAVRVLASEAALTRAGAAEAEGWELTDRTVLRGRLEATGLAMPRDRTESRDRSRIAGSESTIGAAWPGRGAAAGPLVGWLGGRFVSASTFGRTSVRLGAEVCVCRQASDDVAGLWRRKCVARCIAAAASPAARRCAGSLNARRLGAVALVVELGARRRARSGAARAASRSPAPRDRRRQRQLRRRPPRGRSRRSSAPTGPSGTRRRPPRISASPSSPRAQRTTCRLASVPRRRRGALELVGDRRGDARAADPGAGRGQRRDPAEHLVERQLAVAAGAEDGDRRRRAGGPSRIPAASITASQSGLAEPGLVAGGERVAADVGVDDQVAAEQAGGGARSPRRRRRGRR